MNKKIDCLNRYLFLILCTLFVAGCADSGGGKGSDTQVDAYDLGYKPSVRWPEKGDYSYNLSYSYNGSRCEISKAYHSKASYCVGLQDSELNEHCAKPTRERMYLQDCGDDFQEINFRSSFFSMGHDSRLGKSCRTGEPPQSVFKTKKDFCLFLKDEELHKSCFWDRRFEEFNKLQCGGEFSPEPPVYVPPTPAPQPSEPKPPTPPSRDPLDEIPVVQFLKSHGISFEVDWQAIRSSPQLPGRPRLDQIMPILFEELEANQNDLVKLKGNFKKIEVTIYSTLKRETLYIDFKTPRGGIREYIPLLDRMIKISQDLKINFGFIHSGHSRDLYDRLRSVLDVIENKYEAVKKISPMLREIEMSSFSSYSNYSQTLTLKSDFVEESFNQWIDLLLPLAPIYSWAQKHSIKVSADIFDLDKKKNVIHGAFAVLNKSLPSLEKVALAGMLGEVTLYYSGKSEVRFYSNSKNLSLTIDPEKSGLVLPVIANMGLQADLERELQIPVKISFSDLDDRYIKAMDTFKKLTSVIRSKTDKIAQIEISYQTNYRSASKTLSIGYETSLKEGEEIIRKIK